jgi:tetratricopeptide (TPR) repeat protein
MTMLRVDKRLIFAAAALLMIFSAMTSSAAVTPAGGACDITADVALEVGDYATAIRLHQSLLLTDGNNALAHYHLGFAYGMAGLTAEEIGEYRTAIALGLKKWDLFLNLGLAYADRHDLEGAAAALETAVSLSPEHAETHFNLAVVYERENKLNEALKQIIAALVIEPGNLDAANTDAIIRARMGDLASARSIWAQLVSVAPDYAPARTNLTLLNQTCGDACDPHKDFEPQLAAAVQARPKGED